VLPSSFNQIHSRILKGEFPELAARLGDLQWYRKVRELRTEWTHFSSIFIGLDEHREPLFCVRSFRRPGDKKEFTTENFHCTLPEFMHWVSNAFATLDNFAGFILEKYIIGMFDPEMVFHTVEKDKTGFVIISPEGRVTPKKMTAREIFAEIGITV
jgi:hypothetical protein